LEKEAAVVEHEIDYIVLECVEHLNEILIDFYNEKNGAEMGYELKVQPREHQWLTARQDEGAACQLHQG
jgi:hypothetical protein